MAPSFLIVGATGNTGRGVVEELSKLISTSSSFPNYRILALTRSSQSASAKKLAALPGIEIIEQNWVEITSDWLREHEVERTFVASHNKPNQFAEESSFYFNALNAGVRYIVRISTMAPNVRPDCPAYYPRQHWAVEALLDTPAFAKMHWTSLQPNLFLNMCIGPAADLIKRVRNGEKQGTLSMMPAADSPFGLVDGHEVGILAARLLFQNDTAKHNKARYVVNGPENITGAEIAAMVEEKIGAKLEDVRFGDMSYVDGMIADAPNESKTVIGSIKYCMLVGWDGLCKAETTSKEVLELAPPSKTAAQVLEETLAH